VTSHNLLEQLADIGDEALDQLVKDAKKHRAKKMRDKIPQAMKDSLLRKAERLDKGQTTSIVIKPEIQFTFTVRCSRDFTETDVDITLLNEDDQRSKALFDVYDLKSYEFHDCLVSVFSKLEPHLNTMEEQEKVAYDSWNDDYYHLRSEFGVNAWDLVEEMKKGDTAPDEASQ